MTKRKLDRHALLCKARDDECDLEWIATPCFARLAMTKMMKKCTSKACDDENDEMCFKDSR